jgi:hypothetical protein
VVEVKIKKQTKKLPVWRAWRDLVVAGIYGDVLPPPLDPLLKGADRWLALVENGVRCYGGQSKALDEDDLEREVRAAAEDVEVFRRIARVADDLSQRFRAAERQGVRLDRSIETAALLFLPLARTGKPIEPRWDVLVPLDKFPHGRELLGALPLPRREAIALSMLQRYPVDDARGGDGFRQVLDLHELVPGRALTEEIVRRLAHKRVRAWLDDDLPDVVKQVRGVAKANADLADLAAKVK